MKMKNWKFFPIKNANTRDLGGFYTQNGRITKYGVLVRSSLPYVWDDDSFSFLLNYGIRKFIDFRTGIDEGQVPEKLSKIEGCKYRNIPVALREGSNMSFDDPKFDWGELYIFNLKYNTLWIKNSLEEIAKDNVPTVFHCTCGKDKTGLVAMVILLIAGVNTDDILADYCVSEIFVRHLNDQFIHPLSIQSPSDVTIEKENVFYSTDYSNMEKAIQYIFNEHGNVHKYLSYCGVSWDTIQRIYNMLV